MIIKNLKFGFDGDLVKIYVTHENETWLIDHPMWMNLMEEGQCWKCDRVLGVWLYTIQYNCYNIWRMYVTNEKLPCVLDWTTDRRFGWVFDYYCGVRSRVWWRNTLDLHLFWCNRCVNDIREMAILDIVLYISMGY